MPTDSGRIAPDGRRRYCAVPSRARNRRGLRTGLMSSTIPGTDLRRTSRGARSCA